MNPSAQKSFRLLLVDDDEDEYTILKRLVTDVKRLRFEIDWADSSEKALEASYQNLYDAFLVDYYLGSENGVEVIKQLVQQGIKSPIILLTGQGNYEVDEAAQQAGAVDYLAKEDLSFSILERSVRYALAQKNIQDELERRVQERTRDLIAEIQERKQAQELTRLSEARFRALTETTSAAILIIREMEIRYANPAVKAITGFDPEELMGQSLIKLAHPDYQLSLQQQGMGNPWAPDLPFRFELKIVRKDNAERWLDLTTGSIEYEHQPAWIVTAFDITDRDIAETELRKARDELEERVIERTAELRSAMEESRKRAEEIDALQNATSMLLSTIDLEELLANIVDAAQRAIPAAENAALYLLAPKKGGQPQGNGVEFKDPRIHYEERSKMKGYPAKVIRSDAPLLVANNHRAGRPSKKEEHEESIIAVPLSLEGHSLGALVLSNTSPGMFFASDIELLQSFAATAAIAIGNARQYGRIQKTAITDPLTGIYNRRGFFESGQNELERFRRYGHPLSILFMDVDKFKSINDVYGHAAGDRVLQVIVDRSCQSLRNMDIMGRVGGDEFAILLPETSLPKARTIAERIRRAVTEKPVSVRRKRLEVSTTIGVAAATREIPSMKVLLENADKALYRAKHKGRNRVVVG